jgi:hypothetical protein
MQNRGKEVQDRARVEETQGGSQRSNWTGSLPKGARRVRDAERGGGGGKAARKRGKRRTWALGRRRQHATKGTGRRVKGRGAVGKVISASGPSAAIMHGAPGTVRAERAGKQKMDSCKEGAGIESRKTQKG